MIEEEEQSKSIAIDGRVWVEPNHSYHPSSPPSRQKLRFLNYNVLANYKCQAMAYTETKNWPYRSRKLMGEIASYNADIICLQDVGKFCITRDIYHL